MNITGYETKYYYIVFTFEALAMEEQASFKLAVKTKVTQCPSPFLQGCWGRDTE